MADLKGKLKFDWRFNDDIITFDFRYKKCRKTIGSYSIYSYIDAPNVCYLANLIVDESHRNKGIAKQILTPLESFCLKFGYPEIRLLADKNSWVHEWYKRLGFLDYMDDKEDGLIWMVKSIGEKK
jgi:GNAT superfamily N-acetyltransferase